MIFLENIIKYSRDWFLNLLNRSLPSSANDLSKATQVQNWSYLVRSFTICYSFINEKKLSWLVMNGSNSSSQIIQFTIRVIKITLNLNKINKGNHKTQNEKITFAHNSKVVGSNIHFLPMKILSLLLFAVYHDSL